MHIARPLQMAAQEGALSPFFFPGHFFFPNSLNYQLSRPFHLAGGLGEDHQIGLVAMPVTASPCSWAFN
jgi:hypothetical protein